MKTKVDHVVLLRGVNELTSLTKYLSLAQFLLEFDLRIAESNQERATYIIHQVKLELHNV